jgi:hypothetical protein
VFFHGQAISFAPEMQYKSFGPYTQESGCYKDLGLQEFVTHLWQDVIQVSCQSLSRGVEFHCLHNAERIIQEEKCWGSLPPTVNLYRSCVRLRWLARETTGFRLVRASEE